MATGIRRRLVAPPASTNGASARPPAAHIGGLGTAKRSTPMALVGVATVVLGALVSLAVYTSLDRRQDVLAVARPVAPGALIAAEDLRVVQVSTSSGITPVKASQRHTVVGKTAAVGLVPGTLLGASQVGPSSSLQAGQAVVGLALKPGQAPASLRPGTRVEVVDTVKAANGDQPRPIVLSNSAVVSTTGRGDGSAASGTTLVSLTMPATEAPAVAAAAMDGQLSLVVLAASS